MKLRALAQELGLRCLTPELAQAQEVEVDRGHVSDLLSDVLANAPAGGVVVTIQVHMNTIAVAVHAKLAAVVLAAGHLPEREVIERAAEEKIPLYASDLTSFELVGQMYQLGLRGTKG